MIRFSKDVFITSSFYMLKELDLSENNYISTSGLSRYICKEIQPWMLSNRSKRKLNNDRISMALIEDHNQDDEAS